MSPSGPKSCLHGRTALILTSRALHEALGKDQGGRFSKEHLSPARQRTAQ